MGLDAKEQALRQRRIAESDVRERSDPGRPAVPTQYELLRFCHVRTIHDVAAMFVPVRQLRAKRPFDGTYSYATQEDEMAAVLPGLSARHYRIFETSTEEWTADSNTRLLLKVQGVWYVDHPQIFAIGTQSMNALIQDFGVTSCYPSPTVSP